MSAVISLENLAQFNGHEGRPIYISLKGQIFDVTAGATFYGPGEGYTAACTQLHAWHCIGVILPYMMMRRRRLRCIRGARMRQGVGEDGGGSQRVRCATCKGIVHSLP